MRVTKRLMTAMLAATMTGCGHDEREDHSGCAQSFWAKDAIALSFTSSPACKLGDLAHSVDGERYSFATMEFPAGGCVQTLGATLWDPGHFTAGNVGAFIQLPAGVSAGAPVTLQTYLDGAMQDSSLDHGGVTVTTLNEGQDQYYSFVTELPFDEVDVVIDLTGTSTAETVRIYEFCGDR